MANKITPAGNVRFVPQTARADVASMGGGGKGLMIAGKDLVDYGDIINANEVKKQTATVNQANIDNQGYGSELFRDTKKTADANATDFTTNILTAYDLNRDTVLATAPNSAMKTKMQADFSRTRNILAEKAAIFESTTRAKNQKNIFINNGDTSANILYETPTDAQFKVTYDARVREIQNTSLAENVKNDLLDMEVKNLRYNQYSGQLSQAGTDSQVDKIVAGLPTGELTKQGFSQLQKSAVAKKRRFKTDERLAEVERKSDIRDAQASIRTHISRLSKGEMSDDASMAHTRSLVTKVNDPITNEMLFNATTVGDSLNGWVKLPSEDLEAVIIGLEKDVADDGATVLESKMLAAASAALGKTIAGERADQAETDKTVSDSFARVDKRLAAGVEGLDTDADVVTIVANLPDASPKLKQRVKEAFAQNEAVQGLVDMSLPDLSKFVSEAKSVKADSDLNLVMYDTASKVHADMVKTVDKNYPDWQQKSDPSNFMLLDENNPITFVSRENLMEKGAGKYNKSKQFHTTTELAAIGEKLQNMSSDQQLGFIASYTTNLSAENAVIAMNELRDVNPELSFVAAGIASNPSFLTVGTTILRGRQRLKEEGDVVFEVTSGVKKADAEFSIAEASLGVFSNEALHPTTAASLRSAALAIMASGATKNASSAMNMALGGDGNYGGVQKFNGKSFAAPVGVDADMISNVFVNHPASIHQLSVDRSSPRTHTGAFVTGNEIDSNGTLESVGSDMYVVRMKSEGKLLQGAPDTPYTVHINKERLLELGVEP